MSDVSVSPLKNWIRRKQYDYEAIAEDYRDGELSLSEIMKKHGINSWSTVTAILDKMDVKRRSSSEGVRLWYKKRRQRSIQKLDAHIP